MDDSKVQDSKVQDRASFVVSFVVTGDELDPTEISKTMEMKSDDAQKKGEQKIRSSKKGIAKCGPLARTGFWAIKSKLSRYSSLDAHIEGLLKDLETHENDLLTMRKSGYKTRLYCSHFTGGEHQTCIYIDRSLSARLSALEVDLDIEIWS